MDSAVIVLAAVLVATFVLHARTIQTHAVERERLVHLVAAKDGREYAQLRKASAEPKPPAEREQEPELQIGLS